MYTNVDQLLNKMEDLKMIISDVDPDIILLTEVIPKRQQNVIHEVQIKLIGYQLYTNFKFVDTNLGDSGIRGTIIYVKNNITCDEVKFETEYNDHVWIKIKLKNNDSLLCGCIYRTRYLDIDRGIHHRCLTLLSIMRKE